MSAVRRPHPPLHDWPVQVYDEVFGFAWYCGQGVMVAQAVVRHGTGKGAHAYHDFEDRVLNHCQADVAQAGGLYVIHDMRAMQSYDVAARKVWIERMQRRKRGYLRGSTVVVTDASALLKMAVQAVNMVATLNLGMASRIELASDLSQALRSRRISPPARGTPFPGE
jgi:hypothetical protein